MLGSDALCAIKFVCGGRDRAVHWKSAKAVEIPIALTVFKRAARSRLAHTKFIVHNAYELSPGQLMYVSFIFARKLR